MKLPIVALLFVAFAGSALAQAPTVPVAVRMTVTGEPSEVVDVVRSYVARELRSLACDLVEDRPWYTLNIVVFPTETIEGTIKQFGLVALHGQGVQPLDEWKKALRHDKDWEQLKDLTSRGERLRGSLWRAGPPADLERLCREIVAAFDGKVLEPHRTAIRDLLRQSSDRANTKH